jgi:hypothetical protein
MGSADTAEYRYLMINVKSSAQISPDIDVKQRPGINHPAYSQHTMVMPQRNEHSNAARVMTTAPFTDWSRGWPRTTEIYSRPAVQASSSTTTTTSITTI